MLWLLGGGSAIVTLSLILILAGVVIALVKSRVDNAQEHAAEMAGVLEHELGLEGMADFFQKVAVGKFIQAKRQIRGLWERYGTKEKIHKLIARLAFKAFPKLAAHSDAQVKTAAARVTAGVLPGLLDDPATAPIVQQAIVERILGMVLTPQLRTELTTLGPVLGEYGSVQFAKLVTAMGAGDVETIRLAARELVSVLSNRDQLDDELVKRAIKGIPRAVQADPRHWAILNDAVQKAKPPSESASAASASK